MKITFDFKDPKVERPSPTNYFDEFLIVSEAGSILKVPYSIKYGLFNAYDYTPQKQAKKHAISPRWWAEIPPELQRMEGDDGQEE